MPPSNSPPDHPLTTSPTPGAEAPRKTYEPPRIEDDLPLEVMSLACTGSGPPKARFPCRLIGS